MRSGPADSQDGAAASAAGISALPGEHTQCVGVTRCRVHTHSSLNTDTDDRTLPQRAEYT